MTVNKKIETMTPEELRDIAIKLKLDSHSGQPADEGFGGLSRVLDCDRGTITRYMSGKRKINLTTARLLRELVRSGRNPADFLRDTNKRYQPRVKVSEHQTLP